MDTHTQEEQHNILHATLSLSEGQDENEGRAGISQKETEWNVVDLD